MIRMSVDSYGGGLPPLDKARQVLARRLCSNVRRLYGRPAGRNPIEEKGLILARDCLTGHFESSGCQFEFQVSRVGGDDYADIEVTRPGKACSDE
ncbi:MAG: hypothetical protein OEO19_12855 [Gammaproteobacteria bacterium]|nr:hypothetical protein [Gammaproteobacteria bacterium]MDH3449883.1 hypothetical protein [Gammaproteobacteria bacterium]